MSNVRDDLHELCERYPDRNVGAEGNRAATRYFARHAEAAGLEVARFDLDVLDWAGGPSRIEIGARALPLLPGPYSPPAHVTARISAASTIEGLEAGDHAGAILVVHGELAAEQLTPKNYPFYEWESHSRIVRALEAQAPAAIIGATGRNPGISGSLYPFPLVEDSDFRIPSAYLKDIEAQPLLDAVGITSTLHIDSTLTPSTAEQIVALKSGKGPVHVVVCGHVDTKAGTPGALDNGTGVATLLELARRLSRHQTGASIELVPFNGEDHHAAPGEVRYLAEKGARLSDITLAINLDAAGCRGQRSAVSFYECPEDIAALARKALQGRDDFFEGPSWPQSDHMVFAMQGIPAMAITSENFAELSTEITHTDADRVELVDPDIIERLAVYIIDVIELLVQRGAGANTSA